MLFGQLLAVIDKISHDRTFLDLGWYRITQLVAVAEGGLFTNQQIENIAVGTRILGVGCIHFLAAIGFVDVEILALIFAERCTGRRAVNQIFKRPDRS